MRFSRHQGCVYRRHTGEGRYLCPTWVPASAGTTAKFAFCDAVSSWTELIRSRSMFAATGLKRNELGPDCRKLVRHDGKQVLVIAQEGRLFAIANRCPHEGYPLSEGTIGPGCVLTCNWHNWKFDLKSGAALVGRDPVRTYEVVERGGEIFMDFRDPPAEERRARAWRGLEAAIVDNDRARIAREAARLERAGFDARDAIAHAFRLCNDRFEDGMTPPMPQPPIGCCWPTAPKLRPSDSPP